MVVWQPRRCLKVEVGACWTRVRISPPPPPAGFMATEYRKEYQRQWVAERREQYIQSFGGCCSRCGSTDRLEFDHVDPKEKISHRIFSWSHDRIRSELQKCELLCKQCHVEKTRVDLDCGPKHGTVGAYKYYRCRCEPCRAAKRASR